MNTNKNIILINQINQCMLPKLSKGIDETENPVEYDIRHKNLRSNLEKLKNLLSNVDLRDCHAGTTVLSNLIILYEEINSQGPWNTAESKEYIKPIDAAFKDFYGFPLNQILYINIFDKQDVFNICIKILHEKITADNLKKYPSLVEVYTSIVEKATEYDVVVIPSSVLPISLILIDDYVESNKLKGLKCCLSTLRCMSPQIFKQGNYYEVIYCSLKKSISEKDMNITKMVFQCIIQLLQILPDEAQNQKLEDIYETILEELSITTNLYRKSECFKFTKSIIQMHGINCVKKKLFLIVITDTLDSCTDDEVAKILLADTIECLETWVRYCWCVWRLLSYYKVLSALFKILYTCSDNTVFPKIQKIIQTLISLCDDEEQKKIHTILEISPEMTNENFIQAVQSIKNSIVV